MGLFDFFKSKTPVKDSNLPVLPLPSGNDVPAMAPLPENRPQEEKIRAAIPPQPDHSQAKREKRYEKKLSPFKCDTVKLVGCTSEDAQYTIGYMKKDDPLYIKRARGKNGTSFRVFNLYDEEIVMITSRLEECCEKNKIIAVLFEESVMGKASYYPLIKIFWDIPSCENSPVFHAHAAKPNSAAFYKKLDSYVVLDLETTGFDSFQDEIIEIGMAKVENGEIVEQYSTLVNPCTHIPKAATAVNGISDSDVANAPEIHKVIHAVNEFMGDAVIVGHNVTFDLRFLKMAMLENGISKKIEYVDTLSISRAVFPNAKDHKLQTIMGIAGISDAQSHRALDDAINTHKVLQYCIKEKIKQNDVLQQKRKSQKQAEDIERAEKYSDSPLYNKHFVFTGIFVNDRYELEEMVPNVGALLRSGITKKTDYLVKGDMSDAANWTGIKLSKAEEAIKNGSAIQIIGEQEFLELIENAKSALS